MVKILDKAPSHVPQEEGAGPSRDVPLTKQTLNERQLFRKQSQITLSEILLFPRISTAYSSDTSEQFFSAEGYINGKSKATTGP